MTWILHAHIKQLGKNQMAYEIIITEYLMSNLDSVDTKYYLLKRNFKMILQCSHLIVIYFHTRHWIKTFSMKMTNYTTSWPQPMLTEV